MENEKLDLEIKDTTFTFADPEELDLKIDLKAPPSKNITFHSENKQVGELNWDDGPMIFIGDAEESAQIFFDHIIRMVCTCGCQMCGDENDS